MAKLLLQSNEDLARSRALSMFSGRCRKFRHDAVLSSSKCTLSLNLVSLHLLSISFSLSHQPDRCSAGGGEAPPTWIGTKKRVGCFSFLSFNEMKVHECRDARGELCEHCGVPVSGELPHQRHHFDSQLCPTIVCKLTTELSSQRESS